MPGDPKAYADFLAIARSKYLLLGGRHNNQIVVWDLESGKVAKQLTVPDRRVEGEKLAFTPDGKYFACIAHDKIVVTETATNKEVAVTAPPGPGLVVDPPVNPKAVPPKKNRRSKRSSSIPDAARAGVFSGRDPTRCVFHAPESAAPGLEREGRVGTG